MLRAILEGVLLFLLPYAAFAVYLLIIGQNPLQPDVWSKKALSWLTIAALVVCIIGVVVVGARREVQSGTFVPSHVEPDGTFVPGGF
ncbi:MAG: DUF6111 family protein, partial [Beijerinckiaceae bacterium]